MRAEACSAELIEHRFIVSVWGQELPRARGQEWLSPLSEVRRRILHTQQKFKERLSLPSMYTKGTQVE